MSNCAWRQNELRNPSTDNHDVIAVFTQEAYELQQHGMCCLNLLCGIVAKRQRHIGLMTSSRIAAAASSPRPLVFVRSRYSWTGETMGARSISFSPQKTPSSYGASKVTLAPEDTGFRPSRSP